MSNYNKTPSACFTYGEDDNFNKVILTYFLYENDIENKSPTDLYIDLYNMKQELDAIEDERTVREYLKLARLLRKTGQL